MRRTPPSFRFRARVRKGALGGVWVWKGAAALSAFVPHGCLGDAWVQNGSTFRADEGLSNKRALGVARAPETGATRPLRDQRQAQRPWKDPVPSVHIKRER